jgi:chemotaxis protein methyltransferase CheR
MSAHPWSQSHFERIARAISERTGLAFPLHRVPVVEGAIRREMEKAGTSDPTEFEGLVMTSAGIFDDLVTELTVPESYFFRIPAQFEWLQHEALPAIWERLGPQHVVRAWSAGCASGEETYSLAIVFDRLGALDRAHILGTDISRAALSKARGRTYSAWSLRGVDRETESRYFKQTDRRVVLSDRIRRSVVFEYLNLALDAYPSLARDVWAMDLILCRNVFIYFDVHTIAHVAARLFETLASGGWLVTSATDPPLADLAPFDVFTTAAGVVYQKPVSKSAEAKVATGALPVSAPEAPAETALPALVDRPKKAPPARGATEPLPRQSAGDAGEERVAGGKAGDQHTGARPAGLGPEGGEHEVVSRIRMLALTDTEAAERVCAQTIARASLSAELHYVHGLLLLDLNRLDEAAAAVKRAIYLDRSLAVAHFALGSIQRRLGNLGDARKAYRNARNLSAARPPDEPVPLGEGEPAGRLLEAAVAQLSMIETESSQ